MDDALITKHRPKTMDEVIGQGTVVRSLKKVLEKGTSRTFLFSGPPGVGKTTLARLVADALGCPANERVEVDGASKTGIDDMRDVVSMLMYKPLGEATTKVVVVDEAQALSKNAITSLLKVMEEPPAHVVWVLCTSEPTKIPVAIKTRSTHFALKPVSTDELVELLDKVVAAEKLSLSEDIIDLCAKEADGSPRQALANLSTCIGVKSKSEAAELLRSAIHSEEAVAVARALVNRVKWSEMQKILTELKETNPESVRHVVRAYVTSMALKTGKEAAAGNALEILDAFSQPFHPSDGVSPLVLACGKVLLQ